MQIIRHSPFLLFLFFLVGCEGSSKETVQEFSAERNNIVEITANGMIFEAPDSISAGWVTFRFNNPSGMVHFALVQKFPEGKGVADHQKEIAPVFQNFLDTFNGKEPSIPEAGMELPEWYSQVQMFGGPGFLSSMRTSEAIVNLTPGTYVIECYIKTNGVFHSYNPSPDAYGMVHELIVTSDSVNLSPPETTLSLDISEKGGIEATGAPTEGEHWVKANFEDQKVYSHFLGHDVHLVKLEDTTDITRVAEWMNWTNPTGLETPAPAEFIGGTNEMPVGSTTYFKVNLEKGRYAWIAEVPDPDSVNMLVEFFVGEEVTAER